jgi:outer membrane protein assembly factor BamB
MTFPGQTLKDANPAPGTVSTQSPFYGVVYGPSSSNVATLTVTTTPAGYPSVTPLPTNYWTRPIYAENTNWYSIAGNWLGLGAENFAATGMYNESGNYNPYTNAPQTGHILWTKPVAFGGIIGGEFGGSETSNYYATSQYEPKFDCIIIQGIIYYVMWPGSSATPMGWNAVNLQTGQVVWTKTEAQVNDQVLLCGEILDMQTPNQYGALTYLWGEPASAAEGLGAAAPYYTMYDAMTGNPILNITSTEGQVVPSMFGYSVQVTGPFSIPMMTLFEDSHGGLCGYYVNTTTIYSVPPGPSNGFMGVVSNVEASLCLWNSTADINLNTANYAGGPNVVDDWMWRPGSATQVPFLTEDSLLAPAQSSVTVLNSALPSKDTSPGASSAFNAPGSMSVQESFMGFSYAGYLLGISAISSGVIVMTGTVSGAFAYQLGWEEEAGFSSTTGQLLWGPTNRTEVPFSIVYGPGYPSPTATDGAYIEMTDSTLSISGYSLATGKQLWGPEPLPGARAYDSLDMDCVAANGTDYIWCYGGDVYAVNANTGAILWHYGTPSGGLESPYGYESLWTFMVGTVAGGIFFVPEGHMYSPPLYHGAQQLALNITNGNVVWSELAFDVTSAPAVSDGVAVTLNAYDNQIYAWGMGPSKTTVTAPDVGVTTATPVTISGTVTDISAGSQQNAVAANFPNGLPCVSDSSMSPFMESVYMQQPMPTNLTGVPVTISVTDSNGNHYNIGTAISSPTTGFYSLTWTPIVPGNYTVTATFAGTKSYYGSTAQAAFYAGSPSATPAPTTPPVSGLASTGSLELGIAVVVIVMVICVAALAVMMQRRRP